MLLPQTLSTLERDALAHLWAIQRSHQLGLDVCWSSKAIIEKQDVLQVLKEDPSIARRSLMTRADQVASLQDYMRQELEEYLAYRLEKVLQVQFHLLYPDKRGRWDQCRATGWHTLVETVRTYRSQLSDGDPTFSTPHAGDEGYFAFTYRVSCASKPDGLERTRGCTGRELRLWREAGKLPAIADVQGLLSSLVPLFNQWLPEPFQWEIHTYEPAEDEDAATLASLLSFLQTGAPLAAFPASDREDLWYEEEAPDYIVRVLIQCEGGYSEHCDDEAWIKISREELLAWGQEQAEAMRYYREHGILEWWLEDQMVRELGDPALQDHRHTFFYDHRAQVILDEMVDLLTETLFPGRLAQ